MRPKRVRPIKNNIYYAEIQTFYSEIYCFLHRKKESCGQKAGLNQGSFDDGEAWYSNKL